MVEIYSLHFFILHMSKIKSSFLLIRFKLEENDILDETEEFERMAIPEDQWYVPAIHLYFKDDLTVK